MSVFAGAALAALGAVGIAGLVTAIRIGTHERSTVDALSVAILVNLAVFVPLAAILEFPSYTLSLVT